MSEAGKSFCINKLTDFLVIIIKPILMILFAVPEGVFCYFRDCLFNVYFIPHLYSARQIGCIKSALEWKMHR